MKKINKKNIKIKKNNTVLTHTYTQKQQQLEKKKKNSEILDGKDVHRMVVSTGFTWSELLKRWQNPVSKYK